MKAEALRYFFVQSLNRLHASELTYTDDMNRSVDAASEQRTRLDTHHWRMLDDFEWEGASLSERLAQSTPYLLMLLAWTMAAALLGWLGATRAASMRDG